MAPKRGGGGGGRGGGTISTCPGAFSSTSEQVQFAGIVVWFAAYLGLVIAYFPFRKKVGAGKKLIGLIYILSLLLFLVGFGCSMIAQILRQCDATDVYSYYDWQIAITVFVRLANWLLLVVFVWKLNTMLRTQLGHSTFVFKTIYVAISALMGILTCVSIGLISYIYWSQAHTIGRWVALSWSFLLSYKRFGVAYSVLFLLSVLASGLLALMTICSLRSKKNPAGDLIGWVIALTISMAFSSIISVVATATTLQAKYMEWETSVALNWLSNFSQILSFIFILCIAKHSCWSRAAVLNPMVGPYEHAGVAPQQQYAYNGNTNEQTYYQQQQPSYNGTVNVKA
ncbi:hypothetical protein GQ44DRAFT_757822 [Phaeosphaeriaceae sp. PMI808]|nr:hypothetical protein GQ44DRAFT_757822 [Phaeosphaeriaceae sp. PMI808]